MVHDKLGLLPWTIFCTYDLWSIILCYYWANSMPHACIYSKRIFSYFNI